MQPTATTGVRESGPLRRVPRTRAGRVGSLFALALCVALGGKAEAQPAPAAATSPGGSPASDTAPASDPTVDALRADLDWILRSTGWRSAEWGVLAVSLESGDTLYARAPGTPLTPASNVKLLTTAAALHHLGPDFRWETWVLASADVVDGSLPGDVTLYGTGDPGLSDRFGGSPTAVFDALAARLRDRGIRRIEGDVVGDGSFFRGPLLAPDWDRDDLNDWFAAPVGALSFNENVVTLRIEAGFADGAPPLVHTMPSDPGLPLRNLAVTGRGRLLVARDHPMDPIVVLGEIPRGGRDVWRRITIRDPARSAAQALRGALEAAGIEVEGRVRTATTPGASSLTGGGVWAPAARSGAPRVLARHRSLPLREYLAVVNKESHNLYAEAILKTLGRIVGGDGSYEGGAAVVERFLRDELGVDPGDVRIADGSGLSGTNRVSPAVFVALLSHMAGTELWEPYWGSLPEAGNRRELGRMYRTAAAGNLRAKTGTISRVSALSGMVRSTTGERIAFSIIGNGLPSTWNAKRVEDRIGVRLAGLDRPLGSVGDLPPDAATLRASQDPDAAPTPATSASSVARNR